MVSILWDFAVGTRERLLFDPQCSSLRRTGGGARMRFCFLRETRDLGLENGKVTVMPEWLVNPDGTLEISRTPIPPSERHFLRLELYAEMLLEQ